MADMLTWQPSLRILVESTPVRTQRNSASAARLVRPQEVAIESGGTRVQRLGAMIPQARHPLYLVRPNSYWYSHD
jgi:hypothetical protein